MVLALFGGAMALVLAEIAARVYVRWLASDENFLRYASTDQLRARHGGAQFQVHRHLGYVITPGYTRGGNRHNSLGYRGAEFRRQKPPGVRRIVCAGGSTTYGWGVIEHADQSYPARLEALLRESGQQVEVVNAGTPGWTTLETLINFETRVLDLAPDVLVVYHGINDVMSRLVWPPEAYQADLSGWLRRDRHIEEASLLARSTLGRMLLVQFGGLVPHGSIERIIGDKASTNWFEGIRHQRVAGTYPTGPFAVVPASRMLADNPPIYFERNVRHLVALAKLHDVRVVLTTFAFARGFPERPISGLPEVRAAIRETNEILRRVAAETSVELFDLERLLPDDDSLFTDGVHFTEQGNRLRARLLVEHCRLGG